MELGTKMSGRKSSNFFLDGGSNWTTQASNLIVPPPPLLSGTEKGFFQWNLTVFVSNM